MGLGGGGLQTVDDAAVGIDAHMGLHAKVPVVALPVRGHLGVTGLRPVLRRRRCVDDRRIDQRAGAKRNALACKIGIYLGEDRLCQSVPFQQMPEVQDGGLIRDTVIAKLDPGKPAHGLAVIKALFRHRVAQRVPVFCRK